MARTRRTASVAALAPKNRANTMSRMNPRIRETIVAVPTCAVDFRSFKDSVRCVDGGRQKYENTRLNFDFYLFLETYLG